MIKDEYEVEEGELDLDYLESLSNDELFLFAEENEFELPIDEVECEDDREYAINEILSWYDEYDQEQAEIARRTIDIDPISKLEHLYTIFDPENSEIKLKEYIHLYGGRAGGKTVAVAEIFVLLMHQKYKLKTVKSFPLHLYKILLSEHVLN